MTRDFNVAMGLPKGELPKCIDKTRSSVYGRMLREEVQEIEKAFEKDMLHEVLAESMDVLYLTFNLLQECGLERAIEPAFVLKHEDNMKKQHETVAHLAWTRNVYTRDQGKTEAEMAFTVSRTEGGRWLLYSQGKLIKPYDYVPGDYEVLVKMLADEDSVKGPEDAQVAHSSGPHTSQYTFANVGVQVVATSIDSSRQASNGPQHHHGWQPALMTSFMWLANVTGEFLHRMGEDVTTIPKQTIPRLIDDPLGMIEQALTDLKVVWASRDNSAMLRHLTVLIYFAVQMTTNLHLHPYLSSAFLWVHEWQMSKIYSDFAPAESAYEMMQNLTMKQIRDGYVLVSAETRVIGEDSLEEKADVVLTIPVENLLVLVPNQIHLPFAGLTGMGHVPLVAETTSTNASSEVLVSPPL